MGEVLSSDDGKKVPYEREKKGEAIAFASASDRYGYGGFYTLSESNGDDWVQLYNYARS